MTIETEHNGHHITYAENEDVWRCWANEMEAKTLSSLKAKLNQWDAAKRRIGNIPVIIVGDQYSSSDMTEASAVLLADHKSVFVHAPSMRGGKKGDRRKVSISDLAADTAETRSAIERIRHLASEGAKLSRLAREARAAIPRLTLADLEAVAAIEKPTPDTTDRAKGG